MKNWVVLLICLWSVSCNSGVDSSVEKQPDFRNIPQTFNKDIAPIVFKNCSPCHHPNGPAPFKLTEYSDFKKRLKTIRQAVESKYMPPWPADPEYSHFVGEKVLSKEEIARIIAWQEQGGAEGSTPLTAKLPDFSKNPILGKADAEFFMQKGFPIKGDLSENFLIVKIPYKLPKNVYVRAVEFVPGSKVVHHMNGHLLPYQPGEKKDVFGGETWANPEVESYESCYKRMNLTRDDGSYPELIPSVCNYLPGVEPLIYPEGIGGYSLTKEGVFLMRDMHYGPSAKDIKDVSGVKFYFMKDPPKRPVQEFTLGTNGVKAAPIVPELVIPADTIQSFTIRYTLTEKISILTVNPHMHLLGKSFTAFAVTPTGDTVRLIRLPKWKFRWQYFYTYEYPVVLDAGTEIVVIGEFDNTSNNPNNPYKPPRIAFEPVGLNMKSTDEMFQFIVTYLPYKSGDETIRLGKR